MTDFLIWRMRKRGARTKANETKPSRAAQHISRTSSGICNICLHRAVYLLNAWVRAQK